MTLTSRGAADFIWNRWNRVSFRKDPTPFTDPTLMKKFTSREGESFPKRLKSETGVSPTSPFFRSTQQQE
jgi:hypothetical protein